MNCLQGRAGHKISVFPTLCQVRALLLSTGQPPTINLFNRLNQLPFNFIWLWCCDRDKEGNPNESSVGWCHPLQAV